MSYWMAFESQDTSINAIGKFQIHRRHIPTRLLDSVSRSLVVAGRLTVRDDRPLDRMKHGLCRRELSVLHKALDQFNLGIRVGHMPDAIQPPEESHGA
jgi:hypothetical protein